MSESNGKYAPRPGNIPGVPINLGGIDFVLAPLGLRLAREFEAKGLALRDGGTATTIDAAHQFNKELILASLHRNYPEITDAELEALLDTVVESEAVSAVLLQSGLKRVKPGELKPGS